MNRIFYQVSVLHCIFYKHQVFSPKALKAIAEMGIDLKQFIECFEKVCSSGKREKRPHTIHSRQQLVSQIKLFLMLFQSILRLT